MSYPEKFIRGISDKSHIENENIVLAGAFQFDELPREDDYSEASINWNDDDGALPQIMDRRNKTGDIQFKAGAAILSRSKFDMFVLSPFAKDRLTYERKVDEDDPSNEYHGNILLKKGLSKQQRTMFYGIIAACVEQVISQDD